MSVVIRNMQRFQDLFIPRELDIGHTDIPEPYFRIIYGMVRCKIARPPVEICRVPMKFSDEFRIYIYKPSRLIP